MSRENVELSRRFWTVFNAREWDDWWSLLDPNVEWHARTDKPDVDIYRGHDALKPFVESWTGMFPDIRVEVTGDSIDLGDHVITPTIVVGTARSAGITMRDPYSFLFRLLDQKIAHVREFHDNKEALEALGPVE